MISQTAEYALRAAAFLAEAESAQTTVQIAAATQVPSGYLAKVLQALVRAGVVRSQRGLGGGFVLALPPSELSVYDVVQAVDPIARITRCPLNNPDHATELCALHRRLDEAAAQVEASFRQCPLSELVASPPSSS